MVTPIPKPGSNAGEQLRQLAQGALTASQVATSDDALRHSYLQWASLTESVLRSVLQNPQLDELHTVRYWQIRNAGPGTVRFQEMLNDEARLQSDRLDAMAKAIKAREQQLTGRQLLVPDTHVFLHFNRFDSIPWSRIGGDGVSLAIPIAVVAELDDKKGARRRDLAKRARAVVATLGRILETSEGALPDGTRVTVVVDEPEGSAGDRGVLESCETLAAFGADVRLLTGDLSMRIRAGARQVRYLEMPEDLRLPLPQDVSEMDEERTETSPGYAG